MPGPALRWLETTPRVRSPPEAFRALADTGSCFCLLSKPGAPPCGPAWHAVPCPLRKCNAFFFRWHWPLQLPLCPLCELKPHGASLVAQWYRTCLPVQETRVQSLVWADLRCHRAAKSRCLSCWACALEPRNSTYWGLWQELLKPAWPRACAPQEKPLYWEAHTLQQK